VKAVAFPWNSDPHILGIPAGDELRPAIKRELATLCFSSAEKWQRLEIQISNFKYQPHTTKQQVSEQQLKLAEEIINFHAPYQSGRAHQLKLQDDDQF